jgi:thiosulfate dehydrogenase (quinone) large subunit
MTFVFAWIANANGTKDWPVDLMHQTEAALLGVAFVCFVIAGFAKGIPDALKALIALIGGIGAGVGVIMPFELGPFFFGWRGEIMMMTLALIVVYPIAIIGFALLLAKMMNLIGKKPTP